MFGIRSALVRFHDDPLVTIFDGNTARVGMRRISDALGLDWSRELRRIVRDPALSSAVALQPTPFDRSRQDIVTLPTALIRDWLLSVASDDTDGPWQSKIETYRQELYNFVDSYWSAVSGPRPGMDPAAQIQHFDRMARRRELPALLDRIERERNPARRRILYTLIERACEAEGIAAPALSTLCPSHHIDEAADRALAAFDALARERPELNLHHVPGVVAIRRTDLTRAGISLPRDVCEVLMRHPRFFDLGSIRARNGKGVWCWSFRAA